MQQPFHLQTASTYDVDRKIVTVGGVALLHGVFIIGLMSVFDFVPHFIKPPDEIDVHFVETVKSKEPPPPLKTVTVDLVIPKGPDIVIDDGPNSGRITIDGQEGNTTAIATVPPRRIGGQSQPPYPAIARRLGEEGDVLLQISITDSGRLSDVSVLQSSGSERLDTAARDWVLAHWRYQPATRDGKAVATTTKAKIVFKLSSER